MILDERGEFADATALNTGAAGTYLIGDVIDLSNAYGFANGQNVHDVDNVFLVIQVDTTATSGGAATVQFALASDAQAAIATDGTATIHWQSGAIPVATLAAGYTVIQVSLPHGFPLYERYLGVLQTTAVAALTAGKINAFLTMHPANWRSYNNAI